MYTSRNKSQNVVQKRAVHLLFVVNLYTDIYGSTNNKFKSETVLGGG